jgi:hypothetical protein
LEKSPLAKRRIPKPVIECTASQAEWLARQRDRKCYKNRGQGWDEFCREEIGISGTHATRITNALKEFGSSYFELAEFVPVTAEEFRAVAPKVKDKILTVDGEAIPLRAENAEKIGAAIEKLRQPDCPGAMAKRPRVVDVRLITVERLSRQLRAEFRRLASPKGMAVDRLKLAAILRTTLDLLGRLELELGLY